MDFNLNYSDISELFGTRLHIHTLEEISCLFYNKKSFKRHLHSLLH